MKAQMYDLVRILVPVQSDLPTHRIIPAGSLGGVVDCYEHPEGYAVDLKVQDPTRITGWDYENVVLTPDQFEVVQRHVTRPGEGDDSDEG